MDLGGFGSKEPSLPSDGLETGLDGLDTAGGVTGHALQEEQPCLLVQDRVRGSACVAGDILLDVPSQHIFYVLLLESPFHDELVAAINGATSTKLSKEEGEQMLGLPVEHLGNFREIGKRSFLASYSHHLWRSHHKLLFLASNHIGVLVPHYSKHSLEQLIIKVIPIRSSPRVGRVSLSLILLVSITIIQVVNIHFLLLLFLLLVAEAIIVEVHVVIVILDAGFLLFRQGFCQVIQVIQALSSPLLLFLLFGAKGFEVNIVDVDIILGLFIKDHLLLLLLHWCHLLLRSCVLSTTLLLSISFRVKCSLLLLLGQVKSGIVLSHPAGNSVHSLVEVNQAIKA